MMEENHNPTADTPTAFRHISVNDVYAELEGGGTVSVEEAPGGEWRQVVDRIWKNAAYTQMLVVEMPFNRSDAGDTVHFHSDDANRLAMLDNAVAALTAARDALKACGYVDYEDRPVDLRERFSGMCAAAETTIDDIAERAGVDLAQATMGDAWRIKEQLAKHCAGVSA